MSDSTIKPTYSPSGRSHKAGPATPIHPVIPTTLPFSEKASTSRDTASLQVRSDATENTATSEVRIVSHRGVASVIKLQWLPQGMAIYNKYGNPKYQTPLSSGVDLRTPYPLSLKPNTPFLVRLGFKMEIPAEAGVEAQIRSRSGLSLKQSVIVLNSPGTVDADYRAEVGVILYNMGTEDFYAAPGDRIAQMVFSPVCHNLTIEAVDALSDTVRGEGGFGSTGRS